VTALAQGETDPGLREEAIQTLGLMGPTTTPTLKSIYAAEKSAELRKAVVRAFFVQGNAAALVEIARSEKDPEIKRDVVRTLSLMQTKEATDYMLELLK
jgi:HEAT repeat protein